MALGPHLVHRALAFWMQTTGAALLAARQRSVVRMWMLALSSRSAHIRTRFGRNRWCGAVTCEFCWSGEPRLRTKAQKLVDLGEEAPAECCGHS